MHSIICSKMIIAAFHGGMLLSYYNKDSVSETITKSRNISNEGPKESETVILFLNDCTEQTFVPILSFIYGSFFVIHVFGFEAEKRERMMVERAELDWRKVNEKCIMQKACCSARRFNHEAMNWMYHNAQESKKPMGLKVVPKVRICHRKSENVNEGVGIVGFCHSFISGACISGNNIQDFILAPSFHF